MKNNLNMLRDGIESFDKDSDKSLFFYNNPRARATLIRDLLTFSIDKIDTINDPFASEQRYHEILRWLDNNYHGYEWPAHEVHFHTNFLSFASCPFTCLTEISSLLEKMIKEKFAS